MKKEQRLQVYRKYDGHCAYCGKAIKYEEMQVDHIVPKYRSKNFANELDRMGNYNPACRMCNFRKGTLTIEQFRDEIYAQADREMKRFQARMSEAYGLIAYYPNYDVEFYFEKQ
jgi:5-methylcytosine-specific restriction endonuclease McrA